MSVLRVLLVEDSQLLAERLREALGQMPGVEVTGTADREDQAVTMARASPVDAMVLDLQLKQGTGFGVLRALAKPRPAVIVLTNYALPTYEARARELGAEYFLDKSRDLERLGEIVAELKVQLQR